MAEATCISTPAQRHAADVLGELAEHIDTSLARAVVPVEAVADSLLAIQSFLRELGQAAGQLSERINILGRAGGPLSGPGGDASGLPALLDDIERQTWYLIGLVESFLGKRFPSPYSDLRPFVAALGAKALAQIRDLYRQYVEAVRDPLASGQAVAKAGRVEVSLRMTLDVDAEVERLTRQMERLAVGKRSGMSTDGGPTTALSPGAVGDADLLKLWPVLWTVLGCFALGFAVYHFGSALFVIVAVVLVIGLIWNFSWAFIIAMLLGGD